MTLQEFFLKALNIGKHNHYRDFGYPEKVTFPMLYNMYERNDLAKAAVRKTSEKTFENLPTVNYDDDESSEVMDALDRLGLWDKLADVDEWAQVSGYSGLILRIADGLTTDLPAGNVKLDDIVEIIPAWSEQLKVLEWHKDPSDVDNYGKPKSFGFNEGVIGENAGQRSLTIHPSRVLIWSSDGTVFAQSSLLSGYNNLLDMEKVSGAGGEGFWKTASGRLNIEIDKDTDIDTMSRESEESTGKKFKEAFKEKIASLNEGFDNNLITQGMKVTNFAVTLPQPKEFFEIPLQSFAAGRSMPVKELVGMQTGERASTQDAKAWNNAIMSRRNRWAMPSIKTFLRLLESLGAIAPGWELEWDSLADDTPSERLERAKTMSDINSAQSLQFDEVIFSSEEIREEAGHGPDLPSIQIDLIDTDVVQ